MREKDGYLPKRCRANQEKPDGSCARDIPREKALNGDPRDNSRCDIMSNVKRNASCNPLASQPLHIKWYEIPHFLPLNTELIRMCCICVPFMLKFDPSALGVNPDRFRTL